MNVHISEMSEELTNSQAKLNTLMADKAKSDQKHTMELTALSSNLATLRQQLQSTKSRLTTTQEMLTQQSAKVEGVLLW